MKAAGWILAVVLFLGLGGALGALFVYHLDVVKTMKADQAALVRRAEVLEAETKNAKSDAIRYKVYEKEYDALSEKNKILQSEVQTLRVRLGDVRHSISQVLTRKILEDKVKGMTPTEVVAFVGEPSRKLGPRKEFWYYENGITRDPVTGEPDELVQLQFENGKVRQIMFK